MANSHDNSPSVLPQFRPGVLVAVMHSTLHVETRATWTSTR